jgi:hypothetical protein
MVVIIIAVLSLALFIKHRKRVLSDKLALANERIAQYGALLARAPAQPALNQFGQAQAQARRALDEAKGSIPIPPQETPGHATQAGSELKGGGP